MAIKVRIGNQWVPVSGGGGESIGVILAWGGSSGSIPSGYLLCDGSAISRTTYSDLFSTIGVTHGSGDGVNTFNLPNLKDKFIVGASLGTGDTAYPGVSPGSTGGSANAVLPSHTHTQEGGGTDDDGGSKVPGGNSGGTLSNISNAGIDNTGTLKTDGSVSGTNANLPPYYALCYIIKVFNTRATITDGTIDKPILLTNKTNQLGSSGSLTTTVANTGILQATALINKGTTGWTTSGSNAYTFVCPVDGVYAVNAHVAYANITPQRNIWVMAYTLGGGNLPLSTYVEVMDHTSEDYANISYFNMWEFTAGTRIGMGKNSTSGAMGNTELQWGIHLIA